MNTEQPAASPDSQAARMRAMLQRTPVAVAFVRAGRFEQVSEAFNTLFGHGDDTDLTGQATQVVHVSPAAQMAVAERMGQAFAAGQPLDEEVEYVRGDGGRFWGRLQATPIVWEQPGDESIWFVHDVTAARKERSQPTWTAKHDGLTELANRREFERRLAEHVGSQRHTPVSVMWVDVDKFSEVVRSMGPEVGNHFLYGLGQMLVTKVRASDIVARMEDDRFAVLLPDCDQHFAEIVAEKLRASIAAYRLRWGLHRARVKACIGVVQVQGTLETVDAVLGAASHACAEAKAAGGDSVRVFVSAGKFEELAG